MSDPKIVLGGEGGAPGLEFGALEDWLGGFCGGWGEDIRVHAGVIQELLDSRMSRHPSRLLGTILKAIVRIDEIQQDSLATVYSSQHSQGLYE